MPRRAIRFKATICKLGINPVVDPPQETLDKLFVRAGRSKGPIPVRGTLNGARFIQTLVKYSGVWRLYINAGMLRDSGSRVGDKVAIEIEVDPRPRDVQMPAALADAFRKTKRRRLPSTGLHRRAEKRSFVISAPSNRRSRSRRT